MEKFLAYLAALEGVASAIANASELPANVRDAASKVVAASEEVKSELTHPNASKLWDYIKNGGNLHGTPESRKAEGLDY